MKQALSNIWNMPAEQFDNLLVHILVIAVAIFILMGMFFRWRHKRFEKRIAKRREEFKKYWQ